MFYSSPTVAHATERVKLYSYVEPSVAKELQAEAARNKRSMAAEVALAVEAWLAEKAKVVAA